MKNYGAQKNNNNNNKTLCSNNFLNTLSILHKKHFSLKTGNDNKCYVNKYTNKYGQLLFVLKSF